MTMTCILEQHNNEGEDQRSMLIKADCVDLLTVAADTRQMAGYSKPRP